MLQGFPTRKENEDNDDASEKWDIEREEIESPICFLPFDVFKTLEAIPRYGTGQSMQYPDAPSEANDLLLNDSEIIWNDTFLVFISHAWLAGCRGPDWRGYPHADTKDNDKFKLCIAGIEWLWNTLAPGMKNCCVWIDMACLDQNKDPALEFRKYGSRIVGMCDIIFTPVLHQARCISSATFTTTESSGSGGSSSSNSSTSSSSNSSSSNSSSSSTYSSSSIDVEPSDHSIVSPSPSPVYASPVYASPSPSPSHSPSPSPSPPASISASPSEWMRSTSSLDTLPDPFSDIPYTGKVYGSGYCMLP